MDAEGKELNRLGLIDIDIDVLAKAVQKTIAVQKSKSKIK